MRRAALLLVALTTVACAHTRAPVNPFATRQQADGARAYAAGDLATAEARFQLALEYEPHMPQALAGLGLIARQRGDRAAARTWLSAAIAASPELAEAHAALGVLDLEEHQPERAMTHFRAALDVDPGFAAARHDLARALAQRGRVPEAIAELRKLLAVRDDASAWGELADLERRLGHATLCDRAIENALARDPHATVALRVRALRLRDAGRATDALATLDGAIAAAPADPLLRLDRGVLYVLVGRTRDAITDLRRAVALAPTLPAAHFALAAALVETGDDTAALPLLDDAVRLARAQGSRHREAEALAATTRARRGLR